RGEGGTFSPLSPLGRGVGGTFSPLSPLGRGVGGTFSPLSPRGRGVGGEGKGSSLHSLRRAASGPTSASLLVRADHTSARYRPLTPASVAKRLSSAVGRPRRSRWRYFQAAKK